MIRKERVTIKEVAREAGVSTQTISRVVNKRPDVAPDTRKRVEDVIERLGYHPSALARSMIQQRSYTLGVVTAGLKYIGPSRTLNGITQKAEEMGYTLLLKEMPSFNTNNIRPMLLSLLAREVDGIIWAAPEIGDNRAWLEDDLLDLNVPVVFLTMESHPRHWIVAMDNYAGARLAVEHLLHQGYSRIGHISGPLEWWEARERKKGWQDTLRSAGLPATDQNWVEGNWSSASGDAAMRRLVSQYPDIDAVFVANDQMSLSVLRIAWNLGLNIPRDLGVIGYDNMPESAYFYPSLSTISQDQNTLGCMAVSKLVEIIEAYRTDEMIQPEIISIQPELIIRESTQYHS